VTLVLIGVEKILLQNMRNGKFDDPKENLLTPRLLVQSYRRFGALYRLHLQAGAVTALESSETSATLYKSARRDVPEDFSIQ
jgi:hypothetical protein